LTSLCINLKGKSPGWHCNGYSSRQDKNHCKIKNLKSMNTLLLLIIVILLLGGGGFYFGGPVIGGSGLGLILLICLIIFLAGGFRGRKN
jgi:hypothetical protein